MSWKRLRPIGDTQRRRILKRDNHTCQYCFELATEVDHIIPYSYIPDNTDGNLVASCRLCNSLGGSMVFPSFIMKYQYIKREREKRTTPHNPEWHVKAVKAMMDESPKPEKVKAVKPPKPKVVKPPKVKIEKPPKIKVTRPAREKVIKTPKIQVGLLQDGRQVMMFSGDDYATYCFRNKKYRCDFGQGTKDYTYDELVAATKEHSLRTGEEFTNAVIELHLIARIVPKAHISYDEKGLAALDNEGMAKSIPIDVFSQVTTALGIQIISIANP